MHFPRIVIGIFASSCLTCVKNDFLLGATCSANEECNPDYVCRELRCRPKTCSESGGEACAYVHPCTRDEPADCQAWGSRACYSRDGDPQGFCADYCDPNDEHPCPQPDSVAANALCLKTVDQNQDNMEIHLCTLDCSGGACPPGMTCQPVVVDSTQHAICFPDS